MRSEETQPANMNRSQTDERLRYYLNARHADQERLVAELLPELGPYRHCTLRRPQGGPDGGCDLLAELTDGAGRVVVAVGFKNDAGPAASDRAWVEKKFRSDLSRAVGVKAGAVGFVFVTNVDLTPDKKENLMAEATRKGFQHAELIDRELLRLALDRPGGFFVRLRYLDIPMTTEEQFRMLAVVGTGLEQLTARVQAVESEVQDASMQRAIDSPIKTIGWAFAFRKLPNRPLGRHSILMVWPGLAEIPPQVALFDEICLSKSRGQSSTISAWRPGMQHERTLAAGSMFAGNSQNAPLQISSSVDWPFKQRPSIHQLMRHGLRVFASVGIAGSVSSMILTMNELTIVDSPIPAPGVYPATSQPRWQSGAPIKLTEIQWKALAIVETDRVWRALRPRPPVVPHRTPKL
jgi:hypothetical protein